MNVSGSLRLTLCLGLLVLIAAGLLSGSFSALFDSEPRLTEDSSVQPMGIVAGAELGDASLTESHSSISRRDIASVSAKFAPPKVIRRSVVFGRLVDSRGADVVEAAISVSSNRTLFSELNEVLAKREGVSTTSDSGGSFRLTYDPLQLTAMGAAQGELVVSRHGYAPVAIQIPLGLAECDLGVLKLPGAREWAGHVVEVDGAPMALSEVEVWNIAGLRSLAWSRCFSPQQSVPHPFADTRTNLDGQFSLYGLPDGEVAFLVGEGEERFYVAIEASSNRPITTIEAPPRRVVSGQVRGATSSLLAEAEVLVLQQTLGGWIRLGPSTKVGAQGSFELTVRWRDGMALGVSARGYRSRLVELGEYSPGDSIDIELELAATLTVQIVEDVGGEPIKGAGLVLLKERTILVEGLEVPLSALLQKIEKGARSLRVVDPGECGAVTRTSLGRFEVQLDREGSWVLAASAEGFTSSLVDCDVPGEDQETVIRLKRGKKVRGRVLDGRTGEPCVGATVRVMKPNEVRTPALQSSFLLPNTLTDSEGRFQFSNVFPGPFQVGASLSGFAPAISVVVGAEESDQELVLHLVRNAFVSGEVHSVDPDLTPPFLVSVSMVAEPSVETGLERALRNTVTRASRRLSTDSFGRFSMADLPAGDWQFEVRRGRLDWAKPSGGGDETLNMIMPDGLIGIAADLPALTRQIVSLVAGESRGVVFNVGEKADGSARLEGALVGLVGSGGMKYRIEFQSNTQDGQYSDSVVTDDEGGFDFGLVPPGRAIVHVRGYFEEDPKEEYYLAVLEVEIERGVDQAVAIELRGFGLVVFNAHGIGDLARIPRATVQAGSLDVQGFSVGQPADGKAKPYVLPAGQYLGVAKAEGYAKSYKNFEVDPGGGLQAISFELGPVRNEPTSFRDSEGTLLSGYVFRISAVDGKPLPLAMLIDLNANEIGEVKMGTAPSGVLAVIAMSPAGLITFEGDLDFTKPQSEITLDLVR